MGVDGECNGVYGCFSCILACVTAESKRLECADGNILDELKCGAIWPGCISGCLAGYGPGEYAQCADCGACLVRNIQL